MATFSSAHPYSQITAKCFINAPFERLVNDSLLKLFIDNGLQPEIGLEGDCLWNLPHKEFQKIAEIFQKHDLQCTLHAPFFDLVPGGFDTHIVEITREKLGRAFAMLPVFQPVTIVCHLGFEENKHRSKVDKWLTTALKTWQPLLEIADQAGVDVMFENTYEIRPDIHKLLFEKLDAPHLGFCLDTGHLSAFARTSWQPWMDDLAPWLGQLHLHDNDGSNDHHIALGKGIFNFSDFFSFLSVQSLSPVLTLEPHTEEDLWESLDYIQRTSLF